MEYTATEFAHCLEEFRAGLGSYDWMWRILRARISRIHHYPRRLHALLRRIGNPRKPYFIGKGPGGVLFLGDYRDGFSAVCASDPTFHVAFMDFMRERVARREGVYLDLGANVGFLAASIGVTMPGREVVAFEPVPSTARRAAATFALNKLSNARVFQAAVGDEDGEITFYDVPGNSEYASAHRSEQGASIAWTETKVPCLTLDTLARDGKIGKAAFLKIDVEGHEPKAVRGARELIRRDQPPIVYEYNGSIAPSAGWRASDLAADIQKLGPYRCFVLQEPDLVEFTPPADIGGVVNIYCESGGDAAH